MKVLRKEWKQEEDDILWIRIADGKTHESIGKELDRTKSAIAHRCSRLGIQSNINKRLTNKDIDTRFKPLGLLRLNNYTNAKTKLSVQCENCENIWETTTDGIFNMSAGCPTCSTSGFNPTIKGYCYLIYFSSLNLYKIGITNNIQERLTKFGYIPEIILIREFSNGYEASNTESKWLSNIKQYKINTGKLKSGNTETFKYENSS